MSRQRKVILNPVKLNANQAESIASALRTIPLEDRMTGSLVPSADSNFVLPPRSAPAAKSESTVTAKKSTISDIKIDFSPAVPQKKMEDPPKKKEEPPKQKEKDLDAWLDNLLG